MQYNVQYPQIVGEYGAPPVDMHNEWSDADLLAALVANEGNMVVYTGGMRKNDGTVDT